MHTTYRTIEFRSGLEATWALEFDRYQVPWEYEPMTFREGRRSYTPDFRLRGAIWIEVKGDGVKMNPSLRLCPRPLIIVLGSPRVHVAVLATATRLIRHSSWEAALHTLGSAL